MKKFIISLTVLSFFFSGDMFAGDGKSHISLRSGASIPVADYGSHSLDKGCFTQTGFSLGINGVWYFYKNIGAGIDFNFSLHPVNASALATETVANDPFMEDLTIRSDPYNIKTFMAGIYYNFDVHERISIVPKFLFGMMYGRTPFQLYEAEYFMIGPHYYKVTESRDHNLAIMGGVMLDYNINDCLGLGLYIDYTYTKLIFGFQTSGGTENRTRKISYIDTGLKLLIRL